MASFTSYIWGFPLAFQRFRRERVNSFIFLFTLVFTLTASLSVTFGVKYLQDAIMIADISQDASDLRLTLHFPQSIDDFNLRSLTKQLEDFLLIERTFVKRGFRPIYFGEDEKVSQFALAKNASCLYANFAIFDEYGMGIHKENFRSFVDSSSIHPFALGNASLNLNEVYLSSFLARKLQVSINDTFYIHYFEYNGSIEFDFISNLSSPLRVTEIFSFSSESNIAKDLLCPATSRQNSIQTLLIVNMDTYSDLSEKLGGGNRDILFQDVGFSIFLRREAIIESFNRFREPRLLKALEADLSAFLEAALPTDVTFSIQNPLLEELTLLTEDLVQLHNSLTLLMLPIILFALLIALASQVLRFENNKRFIGIWVFRGISKMQIRSWLVVEGSLIGLAAALISLVLSFIIIIVLYSIIPNQQTLNDWLTPLISEGDSLIWETLLTGVILGNILNLFASRNINAKVPISLLHKPMNSSESWISATKKDLRRILYFTLILFSLWIAREILDIFDSITFIQDLAVLFDKLVSPLLPFLPLVFSLFFVRLLTGRRDLIVRYLSLMGKGVKTSLRSIVSMNYLRRGSRFSNIAFLTALAVSMAITPLILSQSAYSVSLREIKRDIGADISISGDLGKLWSYSAEDLLNLSSYVESVTQMIWISASIYIPLNSTIYASILPSGILAIDPESFTAVTYFEENFMPDSLSREAFLKLSIHNSSALAPISFKHWELGEGEYADNQVGTIVPTKIDLYTPSRSQVLLNFTVVDFFYLIPGFAQPNFNPPLPLICSRDFLLSYVNFSSHFFTTEPIITWLIKITPTASYAERVTVFEAFQNSFWDSDIKFLDDLKQKFRMTPSGSIIAIMDTFFFMTFLLVTSGLGVLFFQSYKDRKNEVGIYFSRGMTTADLRRIFHLEFLSIDLLGAFFGILIGILSSSIYMDFFITPYPPIPVKLLIPWPKILLFLTLLILSHFTIIITFSYLIRKKFFLSFLQLGD